MSHALLSASLAVGDAVQIYSGYTHALICQGHVQQVCPKHVVIDVILLDHTGIVMRLYTGRYATAGRNAGRLSQYAAHASLLNSYIRLPCH